MITDCKMQCIKCNSLNLNVDDDGTYECIACGKKFRNHDNHSRFICASLGKTYEYFSDVKSSERRYPNYCQRIDIVQESPEELTTKEFWNLSIDGTTDHIIIEIYYKLYPQEKICYEFIGNYAKGFKNCIFFEGEENQPSCVIDGNLPLLEIASLPPNSKQSELYLQISRYFKHQDTIHLENRFLGHVVGQLCGKCKKGHLLPSGQRENTRRDTPERIVKRTDVTIESLLCDYCGSKFENTFINMM